ncbi:hypothetical protein BDV97DRAFT_73701 [Delphinella strobiligena]|nr:hypothetical protein BDV97DRAFT_73701 [Delphinella strobiligena]
MPPIPTITLTPPPAPSANPLTPFPVSWPLDLCTPQIRSILDESPAPASHGTVSLRRRNAVVRNRGCLSKMKRVIAKGGSSEDDGEDEDDEMTAMIAMGGFIAREVLVSRFCRQELLVLLVPDRHTVHISTYDKSSKGSSHESSCHCKKRGKSNQGTSEKKACGVETILYTDLKAKVPPRT